MISVFGIFEQMFFSRSETTADQQQQFEQDCNPKQNPRSQADKTTTDLSRVHQFFVYMQATLLCQFCFINVFTPVLFTSSTDMFHLLIVLCEKRTNTSAPCIEESDKPAFRYCLGSRFDKSSCGLNFG